MSKTKKSTLEVQGASVAVLSQNQQDFICLTDIAKHKEPDRADQVIQNWMRNRNTVEFLGVWESLNNADFKPLEFEGFRNRAGLNSFVLTPRQWIEGTAAIGLISKHRECSPYSSGARIAPLLGAGRGLKQSVAGEGMARGAD